MSQTMICFVVLFVFILHIHFSSSYCYLNLWPFFLPACEFTFLVMGEDLTIGIHNWYTYFATFDLIRWEDWLPAERKLATNAFECSIITLKPIIHSSSVIQSSIIHSHPLGRDVYSCSGKLFWLIHEQFYSNCVLKFTKPQNLFP